MLLRCGSCSAKLRINDDHVRGRNSAPCPKCGQVIRLQAAQPDAKNEPMITISCSSCHATLRAPASRAGAKSRCPKCRAEVVISAPSPPAPAPLQADDSSGASTRRIDSRSLGLGMMRSQGPGGIPGGIDVDEFLGERKEPAVGATPGAGEEQSAAASILKPPIEPMREAAHGIREAAGEMAAPVEAAAPTAAAPVETAPAPNPSPQQPIRRPEPISHPRGGRRTATRSFPSSRGFVSGALAGALAGGALAYAVDPATTAGLSWLVATMPPVPIPQLDTLPDPALRAILVGLLGGLSGFVAAAIGAPGRGRSPLRLVRCGSIGLLAGASAGAVITLAASGGPEGISFWPLVNWMRDLLLVGLLTPAVHRLLPGSRS